MVLGQLGRRDAGLLRRPTQPGRLGRDHRLRAAPADKPINLSPANAAVNLTATGIQLKWDPGYYGQIYDIYFGLDPNPPLFKADQKLGPVDYSTPKTKKSLTLPTLQPGTTYYWRIVTKTMAGLQSKGPTWSFTTKGTPPPPPPPPAGATTQVIWAQDVPGSSDRRTLELHCRSDRGRRLRLVEYRQRQVEDLTGAGVAGELLRGDVQRHGRRAVSRLGAAARAVEFANNDSVSAQFSDSVDAFGSATNQIGTASGAEFVLQDGTSGSISGWGWTDNGYGNTGPDVYFANTGSHTIRIQQRTDGAVIDQIVISPDTYVRNAPGALKNDTTILASTISGAAGAGAPPLPSPWLRGDVGTVAINGMASYDSTADAFTVIGDSGDIWSTADGMYFAYQPLSGDGLIVARITGVENAERLVARRRDDPRVDGGRLRQRLSCSCRRVRRSAFQRRRATGGSTFATLGATNIVPPRWLRLDRTRQHLHRLPVGGRRQLDLRRQRHDRDGVRRADWPRRLECQRDARRRSPPTATSP